MTLEAWVNPTSLSSWRSVLLKERTGALSYALYATDPNHSPSAPAGFINTGSDRDSWGTAALPLNSWTHLAAAYDGSNLRMYVNGTLVRTQAVTGNIVETSGALRIGGNSVWGEYFSGLIDEVRVYNTALTAAQIQTDMNAPVGGGSGGLALTPGARVSQHPTRVHRSDLAALRQEAVDRWRAAGIAEAQLEGLANWKFRVADLPGNELGFTSHGTIWIDRDAAGAGWFIDPTPADDGEFPAGAFSPASGKVDLLSVMTHEVGHALGFQHSHDGGVMDGAIPVGVRRAPADGAAVPMLDRLFADPASLFVTEDFLTSHKRR
jgi:hypothetical protein